MAFSLEAIYATDVKSEEQLQADIDAPSGKAGTDKALALLAAADALRVRQDVEQASRSVKEALALAKEKRAEDLEALVLCLQGKVLLGSTLVALQSAMRALKLYKEIGDTKGQAVASYVAALVHKEAPNPGDAAWKATEAKKLFQQAGDKMGVACALETMASCYLMQQNFQKGLPAAQDAVGAFRDLGASAREADVMCVLAKMHMGKGELELALQTAKDAMAKCEDLGKPKGEALDITMDVFLKMGSVDDAVFTAQQETARLASIGDLSEKAGILRKLVDMLLKQGKAEQASGPASELAKLYRSIGDKVGEASALALSAKVKSQQRETKEAEKLVEQALDITKDLGPRGLDTAIEAMRLSCQMKAASRQWQTAFQYAIDNMNRYKNAGIPQGEAAMLVEIADMQVGVGDRDGAFNTTSAAIPLFTQAGSQKELASTLIKAARFQFSRNEPKSGLKSTEQAMAIYTKLCDNDGRADAAQLLATGYSRLGSKGNALEAIRAAKEAAAIFRNNLDKDSEAQTLNLLANAQLMNQAFSDAQRTARQAETIFKDLDDLDGQASALLLVAGAHLGAAEFAEARDTAKDARQLFQDANNGKGEDGVDEFLDSLKQYESGALSNKDFCGFTMSSGEAVSRGQGQRTKAKEKKRETVQQSNIDLFLPGIKGERNVVTFFEAFEARRATAPTRGPAARRASEAAGAGEEEEPEKKKEDPVLFAIRLMPNHPEGEEEIEKKPKYQPVDTEDKRINVAMDLGQPNPKFPGNTGKTNRMFSAMGDQVL